MVHQKEINLIIKILLNHIFYTSILNQEIVNERKGFMLTLSLVQDSLGKGDVDMALSITNEKLKKLGTQQTEVLINKPELLMSSY